MARQRNGKIARLPHALRERVNRALLDGQTTSEILAWLNTHPEAVKVFDAHFEGAAVNAENLSNWRTDGYRDWIARRERAEQLKTISAHCLDMAKAGRNISEGAASIVAGQILEVLEEVAMVSGDEEEADPVERLAKLTSAIATLRSADLSRDRLELDKRKVTLKAEAQRLDQEKFEKQTVEQFLKWAKSDAAREILESGKPRHVQMDALRDLMFGSDGKEDAA